MSWRADQFAAFPWKWTGPGAWVGDVAQERVQGAVFVAAPVQPAVLRHGVEAGEQYLQKADHPHQWSRQVLLGMPGKPLATRPHCYSAPPASWPWRSALPHPVQKGSKRQDRTVKVQARTGAF